MAGDGDKELVIRIRREVDPGGEAAARAAYAEERKQLDESVKASQKASRARAEAKKAENDRLKALDKERDDQVKRSAKEQADAVKRSEKDKAEFIKEQEKVKQRAAADTAAKVAAQAKATAQAQATAAKQAAAATAQAMAQQTKATKEAEAAASQMTKALLGSQAVGAVLRQVEAAIQSVAASSMAAGEHIQNMAQKAADMRHADREILALTGKPITAAEAAANARQAARAGVSVEDWRKGNLAFQAQAGQFIGDTDIDPATGKQRDELAKVSVPEAESLMSKIASYSASMGIDSADPAKLAGVIMSKTERKKGESGEDYEKKILTTFAKALKAMQLAPGETTPLIGQAAELIQTEVGEGGAFDDIMQAVTVIRTMAQRNAGEASTYGGALVRGLREAMMDPEKMEELGLKKGMNFFEQLGAVNKTALDVKASGGDEAQFIQKHFPEVRQFSAVRTGIGAGIRGKTLERVGEETKKETFETVLEKGRIHKLGEEGQHVSALSDQQAAQAEAGAKQAAYEDARIRAETTIDASGEMAKPEGWIQSMLTARATSTQGDRRQQAITRLQGLELAPRLRGSEEGRKFMMDRSLDPTKFTNGLGSSGVSQSDLAEGWGIVAKQRSAAKDLADAADAQKKAAEAAKPVVPVPVPVRPPAVMGRPKG